MAYEVDLEMQIDFFYIPPFVSCIHTDCVYNVITHNPCGNDDEGRCTHAETRELPSTKAIIRASVSA
ncbi:hypothetical protein AGMMS49992_28820 [Clostridia bacterium]|nr:hypothetical protein AGMMS49992_28820 [Clostridia bacterium]